MNRALGTFTRTICKVHVQGLVVTGCLGVGEAQQSFVSLLNAPLLHLTESADRQKPARNYPAVAAYSDVMGRNDSAGVSTRRGLTPPVAAVVRAQGVT
jgi:hypothetical protein